MLHKTKIKVRANDRVFLIINYIFVILCLVSVLYPIIYIISASFSSPQAVLSGRVWLFPVEPTLLGYQTVFKDSRIVTGYLNSLLYAFFGTLLNVVLTLLAAYPLSRKCFYGGKALTVLFTFTMLFSGGMIPLYITVVDFKNDD